MNVIGKGILNGKCCDTDFGMLDTDIMIGDVMVSINTCGGINIGDYRQVYDRISSHHFKRTNYYIKLTKANIRLVNGVIFVSANYVLCEG